MMIQEKLKEWNRVIKLSRKPRRSEFVMIAKITGLGMAIIGTIGFIIRMLLQITGIKL
jgi:protein transport protein SEC61 subunit gamma-like protein